MKKIIALAAVILAVLVFALLYQFKPIGYLEFDAYAVTDGKMVNSLKNGGPSQEDLSVPAQQLPAYSPFYERLGSLYAGEDKIKLESDFPLYANDASALSLLNNSAKLINEDFTQIESYKGLLISDGAAFNGDRERSMPDTIMLLKLKNGLFINTLPALVDNHNIGTNSVNAFAPNSIQFYEFRQDRFLYSRIEGLTEKSTIQIAGQTLNYHDFLRALGLMEPKSTDTLEQELPPEEVTELDEIEAFIKPKPVKPERPQPPVNEKYFPPQVVLGAMRCYVPDHYAQATLAVSDRSGAISSPIVVRIFGQDGHRDSFTMPMNDFAARRRVTQRVRFENLVEGTEYLVYGEYRYVDAGGAEQLVRFGEQRFIFKDQNEPPKPPGYVKPEVTCGPFTAGVHFLENDSLVVKDPAGRIIKGVAFEVTRKSTNNLFLRKYVVQSGSFTLGPLPPEEKYQVVAFYEYKDEHDDTIRVNLFTQDIETLPLSALDPLSLHFENGPIYPQRIALQQVYLNPEVGKKTLAVVRKMSIIVDGKTTNLSSQQLKDILVGKPTSCETPNNLSSDRQYTYAIKAYDMFGNEMPITPPFTGETRTCKAPPKASILNSLNQVGNTGFKITITNADNAAMANPRMVVYDMDGALVYTRLRNADGSYGDALPYHELTSTGGTVHLANLKLSKAYRIVVTSDYDILDGQGTQIGQEIGSIVFSPASLDSLGYLVVDSELAPNSPADTSAVLHNAINTKLTDPLLIDLLNDVHFTLYRRDEDPATRLPVKEVHISRGSPEMDKLKAGDMTDPYELLFDGLSSMTEYDLVIRGSIRVVEDDYEVLTTTALEGFKTLRLTPRAVIDPGDLLAYNDTIYLYNVRVQDPDGVIINQKVTMLVYEHGSNALVNVSSITAGAAGKDYILRNMKPDTLYRVEFIAPEYNVAYDYSTYQTNVRLQTPYTATDPLSGQEYTDRYFVSTQSSLSGRLSLRGLVDSATGSPNLLDATVRVHIKDSNSNLAQTMGYSLRLYKRPGYGEYMLDSPGGDLFIPLPAGYDTPPDYYTQDQVFSPKRYYEYRVDLVVRVGDREITLDQLYFDTDGPMTPISESSQLVWLEQKPNGRYLVLEDLVYDKNYNTNTSSNPFNGVLDFQGHSLTFDLDSVNGPNRRVFGMIGSSGVVKNMVFNVSLTGENPVSNLFFCSTNSGTISNVQVNVTQWNGAYNYTSGLLAYVNSATGVIENFVVNVQDDISVRSNFGLIAYVNRGMVRNGYVYSFAQGIYGANKITVPLVPGAEAETFSATNIGGVVAVNESTGTISSVYSLLDVDVKMAGSRNRTVDRTRIGSIVGSNSGGRVQNSYTANVPLYDGQAYLANGPGVGLQSTGSRTNVYYYHPTATYQNNYNGKIQLEALYDYLWQGNQLGAAFQTESLVLAGCYPQLRWPYAMPAQDIIPLPGRLSTSALELTSVMVERQSEEEAIVVATFKNESLYIIEGLGVEYATAERVGDQLNSEGITRVRFRITQPQVYKSSYNVTSFTYRLPNASQMHSGTANTQVGVEFYKPIFTAQDWLDMNNDLTQNYRLRNDLDLSSGVIGPNQVRLGQNSTRPFEGRLDAGYYDANYQLQGVYTLTLPDMSALGAGYGSVLPFLQGGAVINIRVDGMHLAGSDTYVGFVGRADAGSIIDNVHVHNAQVQGTAYVGGVVAYAVFSDIRNCSVNNLILKDSGESFCGGGIAGLVTNGSTIYNSYAYGLDGQIHYSTDALGVGGIVGSLSLGEVHNVYAQGKIVSSTNSAIGGIAGFMVSSQPLQRSWADVSITTTSDDVGGIVGSAGSVAADGLNPLQSIAFGDLSTTLNYSAASTSRPLRRIIGSTGGVQAVTSPIPTERPISQAFVWDRQRVNGKVYVSPAGDSDDIVAKGDGGVFLSSQDLKEKRLYLQQVGLGNGFFYDPVTGDASQSGVENGYLPLLLSTRGTLLPFQTPHKKVEPKITIDVKQTTLNLGTYSVEIFAEHPDLNPVQNPDKAIVSLTAEYINSTEADFSVYPSATNSTVFFEFTEGQLARFVDSYTFTSATLRDGTVLPVDGQIVFPDYMVPTRVIRNAAEWAAIMPQYGYTSENFRIEGDIDFAAYTGTALPQALKLNRLTGGDQINHYTIKNLDMAFTDAGGSFIDTLGAGMQYLKFENITLSHPANGGSYTGLISKGLGDFTSLSFKNVSINGKNAAGVGIVGWFKGNAKSITMENIVVKTTGDYAGALAGYSLDSTYSEIHLKAPAGTVPLPNNGKLDVTMTQNPNRVEGRRMVGGLVGSANRDLFDHCSVEYLSVALNANQTYVGGIAGYNTPPVVNTSTPTNNNVTVDNSFIKGYSYVGGAFGYGCSINQDSLANVSAVRNSTVIGYGAYTGGFIGANSYYLRHVTVENSGVFGGLYVGGIHGSNGYYQLEMAVKDSVVSTVYDDWFTEYTGLAKNISVPSGYNLYIGGLSGAGRVYDSIVVNSKIGGAGASYVGGLVGSQAAYSITRNSVLASEIKGRDYVGGATGRMIQDTCSFNVIHAKITATGNHVGGIVGHLVSSQALYGSTAGSVNNNIFSGSVQGGDWVGGVVGYTEGNLYHIRPYYNSRNHVLGNIVAASNGSYLYNLDPAKNPADPEYTRPLMNRVWGKTSLQVGGGPAVLAEDAQQGGQPLFARAQYYDGPAAAQGQPLDSYQDLVLSTAHYRLSHDQASGRPLYSAARLGQVYRFGTSMNSDASPTPVPAIYTSYYVGNGIKDGYLPYATYNTTLNGPRVQIIYSEYNKASGIYYPTSTATDVATHVYQGGAPIPDVGMGIAPFAAMMEEEPVVPDAYAAGVDVLNIDFSNLAPYTAFRILSGEQELYRAESIENRTYSFQYDFVTPLTLVVGEGPQEQSYELSPESGRRNVMVYGDDWYHITKKGVQSGKQGLLDGPFIHLWDGHGLTSTGVVYDLSSGSIARRVESPLLALEQPVPIAQWEYEGTAFQTFKNYTWLEGGIQPLRLWVKDGRLVPVDPALPAQYDGLIADQTEAGEILALLDNEGNLVDTMAPMQYPKDFERSGIVSISHNLHTDLSVLMVKYENGSVKAFDYRTGEEIQLTDAKSNASFGEYALDFFASDQKPSPLAGLATGYRDSLVYKQALEQGVFSDHMAPNMGSEQDVGENGVPQSAVTAPSEIVSGTASEDGTATGGDGDAPTLAENAPEGGIGPATDEPTPGAAQEVSGGGAAAASSASAGQSSRGAAAVPDAKTKGGSPAAQTGEKPPQSSGKSGEKSTASPGAPTTGGQAQNRDLAKPGGTKRLVTLFNYQTGQYELFQAEDLVGTQPPAALAAVGQAEKENVRMLVDNGMLKGTASKGAHAGPVIFTVTIGGVVLMLGVIMLIRRGKKPQVSSRKMYRGKNHSNRGQDK